MTEHNVAKPWSICVDEPLKDAITRFHGENEKVAGHLSRSSIIRLLLRRGLRARAGGLGDLEISDDILTDGEAGVVKSRFADRAEVITATP